MLQDVRPRDSEALTASFEAAVSLRHMKQAWDAAMLLKSPQLWDTLGQAALHALDVELAIR